jgi:oligopeptide/dipeptide ABC transporter ATP-binding protein
MEALIEVDQLEKYFPINTGFLSFGKEKKAVHAVDKISFNIQEEETLSLVGESGCGKTTTGRLVLRLLEPTGGTVRFKGANIFNLSKGKMRKLRREMQIIFQDPVSSLNPRMTVKQILSAPFQIHKSVEKDEIESRVLKLLDAVGLNPPTLYLERYAHEFSGGQRQRIGIARAIALEPKFIVADEPVSSLDMSVRAQILNLIKDIRKRGIAFLFISHDLAVVRSIAHRVAVMYLGEIVELSRVRELYENPLHPYTRALLSATPIPDPERASKRERIILKGDVPSPINPPSGCRFHTRCPLTKSICAERKPDFIEISEGHFVACHLATRR